MAQRRQVYDGPGGAVGVAVIGVLFFQAVGRGHGQAVYSHGLAVAVWFNVALAITVTALTFALPATPRNRWAHLTGMLRQGPAVLASQTADLPRCPLTRL